MKILVVAATEMEIAPFLSKNLHVETLITGVGATACMYTLLKKISAQSNDFILQAGIAGSFADKALLADTVVVKSDLFADVGISEVGNFFTLFERQFADENESPYTKGKLINEFKNHFQLPIVDAITVNTVTDNKLQIDLYQNKYGAAIETMEGAAFHYVCIKEKIPFLQIRSISNFVGERNKANWKMKESIHNLNEHLTRIVNSLLGN